jgi:phosphatidylglycerophosphate synthase
MFPAWAVALLFVRELLVTALRSSYELRGLALKTSYLAKVKTWVQMMGVGMVFLFLAVDSRAWMLGLLGAGLALSVLSLAAFWLVKRRVWRGSVVMAGAFVVMLGLYLPDDLRFTLYAIIVGIVGITWLSGLDYLVGGVRQLRGHGDFGIADAVRIGGAVVLPCLLLVVIVYTPAPAWPLASLLSIELAVGGLDNLLAHHRAAASSLAWSMRQLGACALLAAALAADAAGFSTGVSIAVFAALGVSALGTAREFWRGRDYYLDSRLREARREPTGAGTAVARSS